MKTDHDPQDNRSTPGRPAEGRAAAIPNGSLGIDVTGSEREAAVVLAQVRWLLQDATEQVRRRAQVEGLSSVGHPLALGLEIAACEAANLMPETTADDYGPERLPAGTVDTLTAAETLARSLPVDAFPAGMSGLVIRICDLVGEARTLTGVHDPDPSGDSRDAR